MINNKFTIEIRSDKFQFNIQKYHELYKIRIHNTLNYYNKVVNYNYTCK